MPGEKDKIVDFLKENDIPLREYIPPYDEFPPPPEFWENNGLVRCKNIFFRDPRGKKHYLAILDFYKELDIEILKKKTGKSSLSFASGWRLEKFLNQEAGAVSVLGLINDIEKNVKVFIDQNMKTDLMLTFIPGEKGSFFGLTFPELKSFLRATGNSFEILELY